MGSCTDHSDGAHSGKLFRQYGKFTISGHCSMVGVPRSLRDLLRVETIRHLFELLSWRGASHLKMR